MKGNFLKSHTLKKIFLSGLTPVLFVFKTLGLNQVSSSILFLQDSFNPEANMKSCIQKPFEK